MRVLRFVPIVPVFPLPVVARFFGCCWLFFLLSGCQADRIDYTPADLHAELMDNWRTGDDRERRRLLTIADTLSHIPETLRLAFDYYHAEHAYAQLQYEEAFRAGTQVQGTLDESKAGEAIRLPSAVLMAELHYEHWVHLDSIRHYAGLADSLLQATPEPTPAEQARVLLTQLLKFRTQYEWDAAVSLAEKGLRLVERSAPRLHDLPARFHLFRALALRKTRNQYGGEAIERLLDRSALSVDSALLYYRRGNSPRIREALAQYALHRAARGTAGEFAAAMELLEREGDNGYPIRYGYPANLRGFRNYLFPDDGAPVNPLNIWREALATVPEFDNFKTEEAIYFLELYAKRAGDHEMLWQLNTPWMKDGRCAAVTDVALPELPSLMPATVACMSVLSGLAYAKRLEYENTGSREALRLADDYFTYILREYGRVFTGTSGASMLTQIDGFAAQAFHGAVWTGYLRHQLEPEAVPVTEVFRRMEMTKDLLFRQRATTGNDDRVRTTAGVRVPDRARRNREATVSYAYTPDGIIGAFLGKDHQTLFRIDATAVDADVQELRTLLQRARPSRTDEARYREIAARLYPTVLPCAELLTRGEPLLVIPDGALRGLPFEALLTRSVPAELPGPEWPFLLHDRLIRYASSYSMEAILEGRRRALPAAPVVRVVEHPQLRAHFAGLHDQLAALAGDFRLHGGGLSADSLLNFMGRADVVQFTVHASGDPERTNNNFLYFSENDSLNTALFTDRSLDVGLVILAACETSVGKSRFGEGTFSTRRALEEAGVGEVVSTLWRVRASATEELLSEMFSTNPYRMSVPSLLIAAKRMKAKREGVAWWPGLWAGVII